MEYQIRNYQNSDYPGLKLLLEKVYDSKITQFELEKYYISNNRSILIAETGEKELVGCTFIEIMEDYIRSERILYVTYVAVDERYRNHGIGRMLLNAAETKSEEFECSAIELTSANYRKGAHEFYKRLGFTKKATTHFIKEISLLAD